MCTDFNPDPIPFTTDGRGTKASPQRVTAGLCFTALPNTSLFHLLSGQIPSTLCQDDCRVQKRKSAQKALFMNINRNNKPRNISPRRLRPLAVAEGHFDGTED